MKDSSTPKDMAISFQKWVMSDILAKPQREMLISWLIAVTTGNSPQRAGIPTDVVCRD